MTLLSLTPRLLFLACCLLSFTPGPSSLPPARPSLTLSSRRMRYTHTHMHTYTYAYRFPKVNMQLIEEGPDKFVPRLPPSLRDCTHTHTHARTHAHTHANLLGKRREAKARCLGVESLKQTLHPRLTN